MYPGFSPCDDMFFSFFCFVFFIVLFSGTQLLHSLDLLEEMPAPSPPLVHGSRSSIQLRTSRQQFDSSFVGLRRDAQRIRGSDLLSSLQRDRHNRPATFQRQYAEQTDQVSLAEVVADENESGCQVAGYHSEDRDALGIVFQTQVEGRDAVRIAQIQRGRPLLAGWNDAERRGNPPSRGSEFVRSLSGRNGIGTQCGRLLPVTLDRIRLGGRGCTPARILPVARHVPVKDRVEIVGDRTR